MQKIIILDTMCIIENMLDLLMLLCAIGLIKKKSLIVIDTR